MGAGLAYAVFLGKLTKTCISSMELNLSGRTALVCGSTQGIGRACARQLAAMGARIVLLARDEGKLREEKAVLDGINQLNNDYLVADFSDWRQVEQVVKQYVSNLNPIHILVNNNGGPAAGPITEARPEAFEAAFTQHLLCNQVLVQSVLEEMIKADYGRIINIISTSVKAPLHGLGVSNTIRAAVGNWAKTLANEVGKYGITVNNVLPGATMTGRLSQIITNKAARTHQEIAEVETEMLAEIPLKRFAKPEEIANAVAFLASPAAAYINGINLPVDGGRTANL
jgi:3-oxoacyl-[acyl-carrier protein] reductase